jgi:hypothetical protein
MLDVPVDHQPQLAPRNVFVLVQDSAHAYLLERPSLVAAERAAVAVKSVAGT